MANLITTETDGKVARVTINRPNDGNRVTKVEFRRLGQPSEFVTGDEYVSTIPVTAMA